MEKYYKEKALLATKNKIATLKKDSNLIQKNIIKVILFGIGFTFYAPTHFNHNNFHSTETAYQYASKEGIRYWDFVLYIAIGYIFFCILLHYVWKYQDNQKLTLLLETKNKLEKEIEELQ